MTESSLFWSNNGVGDGALSPYDDDEFSDFLALMFTRDRATQGLIATAHPTYQAGLQVSGAASPVTVTAGAALVDGKPYLNTASVQVALSAAHASLTIIDRIVLRKSWAAQTVRITRIAGTAGAGVPALVQTDGTTWDIPLAQCSIAPVTGVVTVTQDSYVARSPTGPGFQNARLGAVGVAQTAGWQNPSGGAVSFTIGSGYWLIGGTITFYVLGGTSASGTREARIRITAGGSGNATQGKLMVTTSMMVAGPTKSYFQIHCPTTLILATSYTTLVLEFFSTDATEFLEGTAEGVINDMYAVRVA